MSQNFILYFVNKTFTCSSLQRCVSTTLPSKTTKSSRVGRPQEGERSLPRHPKKTPLRHAKQSCQRSTRRGIPRKQNRRRYPTVVQRLVEPSHPHRDCHRHDHDYFLLGLGQSGRQLTNLRRLNRPLSHPPHRCRCRR